MATKATINETFREYGRGIIGGILFSLPLLYTMEVWWNGFKAPPSYLLSCIVVTFLLLIGYNKYAGFKKDASLKEILWESVEEIGLAFFISFLFLLLISQINFEMSMDEIAGKVIIESMIVAIGISVGNSQMGQNKKKEKEQSEEGEKKEKKDKASLQLAKISILSICGAVLFSSSVAPTEEIQRIALESSSIDLLIMVIISLILSVVVLYFSDFKGSDPANTEKKILILHIFIGYMAALLVGFGFLWFFGRTVDMDFEFILAQMLVLGIPGSLGASAGRLLIAG